MEMEKKQADRPGWGHVHCSISLDCSQAASTGFIGLTCVKPIMRHYRARRVTAVDAWVRTVRAVPASNNFEVDKSNK